jgi:hypothetical protein
MNAIFENMVEVPSAFIALLWMCIIALLATCWVLASWVRSLMVDGERMASHYQRVLMGRFDETHASSAMPHAGKGGAS